MMPDMERTGQKVGITSWDGDLTLKWRANPADKTSVLVSVYRGRELVRHLAYPRAKTVAATAMERTEEAAAAARKETNVESSRNDGTPDP